MQYFFKLWTCVTAGATIEEDWHWWWNCNLPHKKGISAMWLWNYCAIAVLFCHYSFPLLVNKVWNSFLLSVIRNWRQRATVQSAEYLSSLLGDRRCKLSFVFEHIPVLELFTVREPRKRLVSLKAVSGFSYSLYFLLLLFWAVNRKMSWWPHCHWVWYCKVIHIKKKSVWVSMYIHIEKRLLNETWQKWPKTNYTI